LVGQRQSSFSGHPLTPAFGLLHGPGSCGGKKMHLSKERQINWSYGKVHQS